MLKCEPVGAEAGAASKRLLTGRERVLMAVALQKQVAKAVRTGLDLDAIEAEIIEPAAVDEDHKAALWLYAQALLERPRIDRERSFTRS